MHGIRTSGVLCKNAKADNADDYHFNIQNIICIFKNNLLNRFRVDCSWTAELLNKQLLLLCSQQAESELKASLIVMYMQMLCYFLQSRNLLIDPVSSSLSLMVYSIRSSELCPTMLVVVKVWWELMLFWLTFSSSQINRIALMKVFVNRVQVGFQGSSSSQLGFISCKD